MNRKSDPILQKLDRRVQSLLNRAAIEEKKLDSLRNRRLGSGLFFLALCFVGSIKQIGIIDICLLLATIIVFTVLVVRSRRVENFLVNLKAASRFYNRQSLRKKGLPVERPWQQMPGEILGHPVVSDLSLVGLHSLFTCVDETLSGEGAALLVRGWTDPQLDPKFISSRQNLIRRLAQRPRFWIRFLLLGERTETRASGHNILSLVSTPTYEGGPSAIWVSWISWMAAVTVFVFAAETERFAPAYAFLVYLPFGMWSLFQVSGAYLKGEGLAHYMEIVEPLFRFLESDASFKDLDAEIPSIRTQGPARGVKQLRRSLAVLGTEANPLIHLVINAFLPWTVTGVWNLERVRKKLAATLPRCFSELHQLEVTASYVCLYLFQTRCFPVIADSPTLEMRGVYHPLLNSSRRVANDFAIDQPNTLALVTGSNMSGKSTFLRTVGVNQTLALAGAPVFSEEFVTWPARVETCIQVSDSLRDGYSYFYSEVKRLSEILNDVRAGMPVLYLIDEIFRGTNNRERKIGSRAVIQALVGHRSIGFVSTHDLELTELAGHETASAAKTQTASRIMNIHFRDEIEDNQMKFTYRLHHGPCLTTNAIRIMALEGIPVGPP